MISFALFAYNQEPYIREAVESALGQIGEPLEIILSDDCSTDRTFAIMQEAVASYAGLHRIRLNQNDRNLGIANHVNRVAELATGELIILAAGDDISARNRSQRIAELWRSRPNIGAIHSAFYQINRAGHLVGDGPEAIETSSDAREFARRGLFIPGATSAYAAAVFRAFEPLLPNLVHEDKALPFRALLLGMEIGRIDDPLVKYRSDVGVSADYMRRPTRADRLKMLDRIRTDCIQKLADLRFDPSPELERIVHASCARCLSEMAILERPTPAVIWRAASTAGWAFTARTLLKRLRFAVG